MIKSDRPIFVIGCPRSGTTMLQLMLHSHPRIGVPPETRFVVPGYYRRFVFGDLREEVNRRRLGQWIVTDKDTKFKELKLDGDRFIEDVVAGPPTLGSAIGIAFRSYAEQFGKARWGDKRPSYYHYVDILLRLFPDAQFIHLIRDGRDCVASLKEMPWYTKDVFHAVNNWAEAIDFGRRHAKNLPADSYYELRYEDLTRDPETELRGLCGFLGEEYDPAMSEPCHVARQAIPQNRVWHLNTHGDVTTARTGSWKARLEPWEVSLCETVLAERLTANGYELTGAPKADKAHVTAVSKVEAKRRAARRRKDLRDRINRFREPGPVAAQLTTRQLGELARV
ncbi:sulfotransferase [Planobispora rosea]|uniref:Sulfotransferase n=1 Tax=Planobispora rosea TaxID=35762 RepID=A0A8J3S592_PLARO|nr:sulfotransferase [Planobispora rosea]GGS81493.1 sulfotransferase [Planobispora rosea]GIH86142.1 sulfotransferase [Planobispora rosea]